MATPGEKLPVRPLGSQGLMSSAQGLGCMGMSAAYKDLTTYKDLAAPSSEETSIQVLHRALELGVSHLDTSDMYGPFENEKLVGKAIKGLREKYMIATKFGIVFTPTGMAVDGSRKHVREAVEGSLERLGISCIDLYYQHRVDRRPEVPIEETWTELKALVEEGKVKYLGISEASADEIRRAHAIHPISACQLEWSLWTRNVEEEIVPTLRELGIGIVAYSPLGRGFLTGAISSVDHLDPSDGRATRHPRFMGDNFAVNLALVEKATELARQKGITPGQLALAWVHEGGRCLLYMTSEYRPLLLTFCESVMTPLAVGYIATRYKIAVCPPSRAAQGEDVFPIPGTKKIKYLEENAAAFWVELTKAELKEVEEVFHGKVAGDRYNEGTSKMSFESALKAKIPT